ncbi:MAG TPA: TolC family protein [Fibrobacteria bacterium]|nr:TolC family protein [Fibrobacteria bacterium]
MTLEAALQSAARQDPEVKALSADEGAAAAERRQARLPLTPSVEASYRFGDKEDKVGVAVTEDLSHLLLYPLKWGLAGARYDEARMRTAIGLADRELEVKKAFYALQAAQQAEAVLLANRESADAAAELAALQRKAGNTNALQEDMQIAQQQDAFAGLARARNEAALARQELALLIGMPSAIESLQVADSLPAIPPSDPRLQELLKVAFERGPDLEAAKAAEIVAGKSLWLARFNRLPLRAGVDWEREGKADYIGPKLEVQVPLDLGWSSASRAEWEREAARRRAAASEAGIHSRIASLRVRMASARNAAEYLERTILPHRKAILEETQKHYNFMLEGVYELIQARQRVYAAELEALAARKDYWTARAELERTLGAPLPKAIKPADAPPARTETVPEPAPGAPDPSGRNHGGH